MNMQTMIERAMEQGRGILRLAPNWVPRFYCIPGRRIKLHPDDYYVLGAARGGIDERWFSSTTPADNGPLTSPNEGLSFVVVGDERVLLRDAVAHLKGELIGDRLWQTFGAWPMYSKFFDNLGPLPHHVHHSDAHAALVGKKGKPESYYFPPQVNNHGGDFPFTFFGLEPGTTKDQIRECLANFEKGDNRITDFSRAYRLRPGTGWDVPPGLLHAPGSLCTYEPQAASDVFAMYQSVINNRQVVPVELLWKDTPVDKVGNLDHLIDVLDWDRNVDPDFVANRFMAPKLAQQGSGFVENWVCWRSPAYSAKELTVTPGATVTITDAAAYGLICMQGHGSFGGLQIESPAIIRYGQLTFDEYFVSEPAAQTGVTISNASPSDPLVILKHFGPENPDMASWVAAQETQGDQ